MGHSVTTLKYETIYVHRFRCAYCSRRVRKTSPYDKCSPPHGWFAWVASGEHRCVCSMRCLLMVNKPLALVEQKSTKRLLLDAPKDVMEELQRVKKQRIATKRKRPNIARSVKPKINRAQLRPLASTTQRNEAA